MPLCLQIHLYAYVQIEENGFHLKSTVHSKDVLTIKDNILINSLVSIESTSN
jgi:hypothetical protein